MDSMNTLTSASTTTLLAAGALGLVVYKLSQKGNKLPPGPPSDPVIGHLRILLDAQGREEHAFYELGKKYGGVVHLDILGQRIVVVNDMDAANELLEKRGSIYSSRPRTVMNEIMGITQDLSLMPYGENFRIHRRLFMRYFRQESVKIHHAMQSRETNVLLKKMLARPEDYESHLFQFATAVTIELAYGHRLEGEDDPYVKIADDVQKHILPSLVPSNPFAAGLAVAFPFLKYLPEWFPGAYHPRRAYNARPYVKNYYEYPLQDVSSQLKQGTAKPSFLATQLDEYQSGEADNTLTMTHIKGAAAMIYEAGTGTMHSALAALIAAMVKYPECLKKVHAEIDRVVGTDRLPTFEDRESLTYLERCLWEVHRWNPTLPLLPHASIEDDVYEGVHIPKGSIVMGNVRGISWNEKVYKDPFTYNPDRYLPGPNGPPEPHLHAAFGWGRRVCPGRWFGQDSVWIAAACILATLNIRKPLDANGNEYEPKIEFKFSGVASHPLPFECRIEPRSEQARKLISDVDI